MRSETVEREKRGHRRTAAANTAATIDLSIVIVSWNSRDFLLKCLQSIRDDSSSLVIEVIVVDNASADGSLTAVRREFPEVQVIENSENLGFARANNQAIAVSRGQYICLVNSDVEVDSGCLPLIHQYMEANQQVGVLGPKIFNPDRTLQVSWRRFPSLSSTLCRAVALDSIRTSSSSPGVTNIGAAEMARQVDILSGCFLVVRRSAMDKVGLLDEQFFMYAEDKDWCKRFRTAGWLVMYYPAAGAVHYGGASSSLQPSRFYVEHFRANMKYWRKHHNTGSFLCFFLLTLLHQVLRIGGGGLLYLIQPSRRQSARFLVQRSLACTRFLLRI